MEPTRTSRPTDSDRPAPPGWPAALRYALFQLPELGLAATVLVLAVGADWVARSTAIAVLAAWVVKDVVLFPFVRQAYAPHDGRLPRDPRGQVGIAPDGVGDEGYVRLGPERWRARRSPTSGPITPGSAVRVIALHGLTLEVEACPTGPGSRRATGGPDA